MPQTVDCPGVSDCAELPSVDPLCPPCDYTNLRGGCGSGCNCNSEFCDTAVHNWTDVQVGAKAETFNLEKADMVTHVTLSN